MAKRVNEVLVDCLRSEGVKLVFGLPGGHNCHILYDALYEKDDIKPVLFRHEAAAVFAALGYAQVTGEVAFCSVAPGPGWAQALPGIHEARAARLPLVVLSADVTSVSYGMGASQEIPQEASSMNVCKWTYTVTRPDRIQWAVRRAFSIARNNPPGPVLINMPADLGGQLIEPFPYHPSIGLLTGPDPESVKRVGDVLLAAKRPVIVAGRGIHASKAWSELKHLVEKMKWPVVTTNSGKGSIEETHELCFGGIGINATPLSQAVIAESDLLFWIGSQIEEFAAGKWQPLNKRFVHCDVDPFQIARNWYPDAAMIGDAKLALRQLATYLQSRVASDNYNEWFSRLMGLRGQYKEVLPDWDLDGVPVHPYVIAREVNALSDRNAIIVLGEGANRVWTATYCTVKTPGNWVSASDYGCMGFSVPAAIGAKLARPESQVICVTGDGSFQMQMQEIPTAMEYGAPVTWVIMNNQCLGWIKWIQSEYFGGRHVSVDYTHSWQFDLVAKAAGCYGVRVETPRDVRRALSEALRANSRGVPSIVDIHTRQLAQTPGFLSHQRERF